MDTDATILELAARQHGVVARAQLTAGGISVHAIEHRLKKGRLVALHYGVYRVGPISAPYEREMAAVLACGPTAVVSHSSAAMLWSLLPRGDRPGIIHISIQRDNRAHGAGVRVHRMRALRADEFTQLHTIPLTAVARTLVDAADEVGAQLLERMVATAERAELVDLSRLQQLLARHKHRRGAAKLRHLLGQIDKPAFTRSGAESQFLELIRKAELRPPAVNAKVRGFEVDFVWRTERLVVEIDGYEYHSSRDAFDRDHERDAALTAAGLRVMRVTWSQLTAKPEVLLARVAQALARHDQV